MELSVSHVVLLAKQHEIDGLRRLASKAGLVGAIGELIHTLQNERGALMARLDLSEEDAYKTLRKTAMDQNRRLVDVAEPLLDLIAPKPGSKL